MKKTGFERLTVAELEAFIVKNAPLAEQMQNLGIMGLSAMVADAVAELAVKRAA